MHKYVQIALLASIALRGVPAQAATPDPATSAAILAPYLDEQTIAVAHIDLDAFDFPAVLDYAAATLPDLKARTDELRTQWTVARAMFLTAGFHHAYLVFSLADIPDAPPLLILPKRGGADASDLVK